MKVVNVRSAWEPVWVPIEMILLSLSQYGQRKCWFKLVITCG